MCKERRAPAFPFPGNCPSCSAADRGVAPSKASKLTSLPILPHPSQQSRDDKQASHGLAYMTLQVVLKHQPGEGITRRQGGQGASSIPRNLSLLPPKPKTGKKLSDLSIKPQNLVTECALIFLSFLFLFFLLCLSCVLSTV